MGGYMALLVPRYVAPSPGEALQLISERYGDFPSGSGSNISGIERLRQDIANYPGRPLMFASLVITAPHTHWAANAPIVVSFDGEKYSVGATLPNEAEVYRPISFAFGPRGPLPYEWADTTVSMDRAEYREVLDCVRYIGARYDSRDCRLGLGVNYRFKALFDAGIVSTTEFQNAFGPDESAIVVKSSEFEPTNPLVVLEQVAWHSACTISKMLSKEEESAFAEVQLILDFLKPFDRLKVIQSLNLHDHRE